MVGIVSPFQRSPALPLTSLAPHFPGYIKLFIAWLPVNAMMLGMVYLRFADKAGSTTLSNVRDLLRDAKVDVDQSALDSKFHS